MDLATNLPLRLDPVRGAMSNKAEDEHRADQFSGVFAILIGKLENAVTLAADGQGRQPHDELLSNASKITS